MKRELKVLKGQCNEIFDHLDYRTPFRKLQSKLVSKFDHNLQSEF